MLKSIIISLRPKQWIKNLFVFLPLLFSGNLFKNAYLLEAGITFALFCLASCSAYLLNDVLDRQEDRVHPLKSRRPIARGRVSAGLGISLSLLFFILSLVGGIWRGKHLALFISAYLALNIAYTLFIKHIAILDVISIALGFELRVWAGAAAVGIQPSGWLQVCTFLLALFLGFAKRKGEILSLDTAAAEHRRVLACYRPRLIEQFLLLCSGLIIAAYVLYALSWGSLNKPRSSFMAYTVIFVIYGVFRYLYLIDARKESGDPTEILVSDIPLLLGLTLWFFSILAIIYLF